MLEVKNLHATIAGKEILKGIDLTIRDGETHAIMGPNGSGKSTLSAVLVGNPLYEVTEGEAYFNGKNLLDMKPESYQNGGNKGTQKSRRKQHLRIELLDAVLALDAVPILVQTVAAALLAPPFAVWLNGSDRAEDMKVRVRNTAVLFVRLVDGKVGNHAPAHKLL